MEVKFRKVKALVDFCVGGGLDVKAGSVIPVGHPHMSRQQAIARANAGLVQLLPEEAPDALAETAEVEPAGESQEGESKSSVRKKRSGRSKKR
jgi:hypothetical protein